MFNSMIFSHACSRGVRLLGDTNTGIKILKSVFNPNHSLRISNAQNICKLSTSASCYSEKKEEKLMKSIITSNVNLEVSEPIDLAQNVKKRVGIQRRKRTNEDELSSKPGFWNVVAFASAEEYDLERLKDALLKKDLYQPVIDSKDVLLAGGADVLHMEAKYKVSTEPRQVFFFREGSVVMWNIPEIECLSILEFINKFEIKSYDKSLVQVERDNMTFTYEPSNKRSYLQGGHLCLCDGAERANLDVYLDRFTFSNAMALSIKLGIWEAMLDRYIDGMEFVTEDLKIGKEIRISRGEVLRKTGELFALRHSINLSSDLLDTPDFYWDHDELETLYVQSCNYFSIGRRTRVMNEKLNHCVELVELLSSHLSDRHHVRLEWMIIVLIMVEVLFEVLHYTDVVTKSLAHE